MSDLSQTPSQAVTAWLADFDNALRAGSTAAATALFADDSYWRDLVSFTWNIKTMEGRDEMKAMLDACLADVQPSNWQLEGEASHADLKRVMKDWTRRSTAWGPCTI